MLPLEGLIVVAVEQAVAAPFCSSRLADAGAHVVKVERPEGDFARGYDAAAKGQSSYFVWLNRGKNSVVVDLATKEGKDELRRRLNLTARFLCEKLGESDSSSGVVPSCRGLMWSAPVGGGD